MARSKKEIDKELMYKKLMPTSQNAGESFDDTPSAIPSASVIPPEPDAHPQPAVPTETQNTPEPIIAAAESKEVVSSQAEHAEVSAAAAIVSGNPPEPSGEIINVMEELVHSRLDAALDKFRCCKCDKCRKDVMAITLNKLAPCYILSTDTAKKIEAEAQYTGQAATALVQAILTVKSHPGHE